MTLRAYIRHTAALPAERQRTLVTASGATVVYDHAEDADAREAWLRSLRPTDTALIARLDVLAHPASELDGVRPSADAAGTLAMLHLRGCRVVEAVSGISSDDREAWRRVVVAAANLIAGGRQLSSAAAREMGRPGVVAARAKSVVLHWRSAGMRATRERYGHVWRDTLYTSDVAAADAINAALATEQPTLAAMSASTARRIFGARRPKGGRKSRS